MGLVHAQVRVSSPANPSRGEQIELLVDTGAMLSVIPREVLERLGITPLGAHQFRGSGGVIRREIGAVMMGYDDAVAGVTSAFGEDGDPTVMGLTALESLGYEIDQAAGELRRTEMLQL